MRKTLLLAFIHGFKGGDDTFGTFPEHLRTLISHALPKIDVLAITYPKFETRGELKECVERFREWLQNKVIDLEVAHSTPSPTVDPSVHVVLVGHSMGGIVAAEALLLLVNDQPLSSSSPTTTNLPSNTTLNSTTSTSHPATNQKTSSPKNRTTSSPSSPSNKPRPSSPKNRTTSSPSSPSNKPRPYSNDATDKTGNNGPIFPHITGLLAFDTPFLGISPGVIAHGAEGHYQTASTAYSAFSELSSAFGWGSTGSSGSKSPASPASAAQTAQPAGLLTNGDDAAASPRWQSWGKYAMFAGAAGAVAAGGAAALYSQREKISSGWGWTQGHLEFVGCLLRGEELKTRVETVAALNQSQNPTRSQDKVTKVTAADNQDGGKKNDKASSSANAGNGFGGSVNFYTILGRGANKVRTDTPTKVLIDSTTGEKRTFVKLPPPAKISKSQGQKSIASDPSSGGGGGGKEGLRWIPAVNDKATDEITAHTSMFYPRDNPGFYGLGEQAKEVVVGWVVGRNGGWYGSSTPPTPRRDGRTAGAGAGGGGKTYGELGDDGWDKPDYEDEAVKAKRRRKDREFGAGARTGASEPVWVSDGDGDVDVRMRDASVDAEDLESSVVVDKAG